MPLTRKEYVLALLWQKDRSPEELKGYEDVVNDLLILGIAKRVNGKILLDKEHLHPTLKRIIEERAKEIARIKNNG